MDTRAWLLFGGLTLAAMAATLILASPSRGATNPAEKTRRLEIMLDVRELPEHDRLASEDRLQAIDESLQSGVPLFLSFDSRETLRDTLAILAEHGVDVGDSALVNFDNIEAEVPLTARGAIRDLPFVTRVRKPPVPSTAGTYDSEGLEIIGSDLANTAGLTGDGVTVAIIDKDWNALNDVITLGVDELKPIPEANQFEQQSSTNTTILTDRNLNGLGEREHGTAAAEVVYEVAPDADLLLYGIKSVAGIEVAIGHAVAQGAKVILVPLSHFETMSDPNNRFKDDIDAATTAGATVVVAAGNEAMRHWSGSFLRCNGCTGADVCNDVVNNTKYHLFVDPLDELPLNFLEFDDDHYDAEMFDLTCVSAIQPGVVANCPGASCPYKMELWEFDENLDALNVPDEPLCPDDAGSNMNRREQVGLGLSFERSIDLFDPDFDEHYFYLAVNYTGAGNPPNNGPAFRIACTNAVGEMNFFVESGSLSDLAVVQSALTVSEVDAFDPDKVTDTSSRGPTGSASVPKPDVAAPGIVDNFAVQDFDFVFDWTFNGTSAAASHVAGIVALMQDYRLSNSLPLLTPAQAKQWIKNAALDIDDVGFDEKTGEGLAQVPVATFEGQVGPLDFYSLTPCRVVDTRVNPGPTGGASAPLQAGVERKFEITGKCGIPATAKAVSGNIAIVSPSAPAFATLFPGDGLLPAVSAVNFLAGGVTNNNTMLKVAANGTGTFRGYVPVGTAHLIFDVNGYFQ